MQENRQLATLTFWNHPSAAIAKIRARARKLIRRTPQHGDKIVRFYLKSLKMSEFKWDILRAFSTIKSCCRSLSLFVANCRRGAGKLRRWRSGVVGWTKTKCADNFSRVPWREDNPTKGAWRHMMAPQYKMNQTRLLLASSWCMLAQATLILISWIVVSCLFLF